MGYIDSPNKRIFVLVPVISIVFVIVVGISWYFFAGQNRYHAPQPGASNDENPYALNPRSRLQHLPACGDSQELFTQTPIKSDGLWYIRPLGFLGAAPEHIVPTDHLYLYPYLNEGGSPIATALYSPGDIWITQIEEVEFEWVGGDGKPFKDYYIYFSPCKDVGGFFNHVSTVSDKIKAELKPPFEFCDDQELGRWKTHSCTKFVNIKIKAGEQIGIVGQDLISMDFGLYDYRTPGLAYANPARWDEWRRHLVCPLEYFSPGLKSQLKSLLGERSDRRTADPICGEINQDIKGTAQGVWFQKGGFATPQFSLVHDFQDPSIGAIAIGLLENLRPVVYFFTPTKIGFVNRDFKDIKDDRTYCYDNLFDQDIADINRKASPISILVQLTSPTTLKVGENRDVSCGTGPWRFNKFDLLER